MKLSSQKDKEALIELGKTYSGSRKKELEIIDLINSVLNSKPLPMNISQETIAEFKSLCQLKGIGLTNMSL